MAIKYKWLADRLRELLQNLTLIWASVYVGNSC